VEHFPAPVELGYNKHFLFIPSSKFQHLEAAFESKPVLRRAVATFVMPVRAVFGENRPLPGITPYAVFHSLALTIAALVVCLVFCPRLLYSTDAFAWILAGLFAVFLQHRSSQWISDSLPALHQVQFPWRFSLITVAMLSVVAASAWDALSATTVRLVPPKLFTAIFLMILAFGSDMLTYRFCDFNSNITISNREGSMYARYSGRPFSELESRIEHEPLALLNSLYVKSWRVDQINSRRFQLLALSSYPDTAVLNLVCFPGWRVFDEQSGREVPFGCDPSTGLRTVGLPAGESRLAVQMDVSLVDRVGPLVSLLASLGVACLLLRSPRSNSTATESISANWR